MTEGKFIIECVKQDHTEIRWADNQELENFARERDKNRRRYLNDVQNRQIETFVRSQSFVSDEQVLDMMIKYENAREPVSLALSVDEFCMQAEMLYGLDLRKIYCVKTGQIIGTRSAEQLGFAVSLVRDKIDMLEQVKYLVQDACASHWHFLSADRLQQLVSLDPVGYFVFAASIALHKPIPHNAVARKSDEFVDYELGFLKDKITLHDWLKNQPIELVIRANAAWRHLLAYCSPQRLPQTIVWPFASLRDFANQSTLASLSEQLIKVLAQVLKRDGLLAARVHIPINVLNETRLRNGGNDLFHLQGKYELPSLVTQMDNQLKDFGMEFEKYIPHAYEKPVEKKKDRLTFAQSLTKLEKTKIEDTLLDQATDPTKPKNDGVSLFLSMLRQGKK